MPAVVKDQLETSFLPTTYGSVLFKTFMSPRNAAVVDRIIDAGGIGEDTAGSLRGPASHESLYGLRPTMGMVSTYAVMPQAPTRDTIGPISRTVEDAAIVLDVIAGYDARSPLTARSIDNIPQTFTAGLADTNLSGLRFGILRAPLAGNTDTTKPDYLEIQGMVTATAAALEAEGAEIIDAVDIPGLKEMVAASGYNFETEAATDAYLKELPDAPFQTWAAIAVDPRITESRKNIAEDLGRTPEGDPEFAEAMRVRGEMSDLILQVLAENDLDGLIYAPFDHAPPPLPGSTKGSNRLMSTYIGFPSIVVPAGLNAEGLPIGVEIMGRPWQETMLFKAAYAYEQSGTRRILPPTAPALD